LTEVVTEPRDQEPDSADEPTTGVPAGAARPATDSPRGAVAASPGADAGRRQRLVVAGIAVAAALVAIALCAGVLGVVSAVSGARDRAADAREDRRQQDTACLELERRLNHLTPPGATATPQARATAIRDENAAVRIYVAATSDTREQDAWRQLLDARTAYAEALEQQAKARTPAFFVAPKTSDGSAVSDQLAQWSPASCAGLIRRLAAPDL
jgi:thioesterase domain-containing protein